jgi:YbgC/YbaW family acyl-CoA thioester hydrolase
MAPSAFHHTHRVTYADCTLGNHVYYARYLDFLEAARAEFFRHLDSPLRQWQEQSTLFPVLECRLQWHAPARYDEVLRIELWPTAARGVRLNFAYRVCEQAGRLILEGETCHACTGLDERPRRLPPELVAKLASYLRPAPNANPDKCQSEIPNIA